jgi:hypothetical protein
MARLAALVPPPRMHLTRYHGVFAPHSKLRAAVTPAGRGKGQQPQTKEGAEPSSRPRHVAMNWAMRLKRVFGIDIEACARCGGKLKIIASIEEPAVIAKIPAHLQRTAPDQQQSELSLGARAPPVQSRLLLIALQRLLIGKSCESRPGYLIVRVSRFPVTRFGHSMPFTSRRFSLRAPRSSASDC